jgi:hypothetical protein
LSSTDHTWTALGVNPDLHSEKPVTGHLTMDAHMFYDENGQKMKDDAKCDIVTAVLVKMLVFYNVVLCCLVNSSQCLNGSWCLHLQCQV